MSSPSIGTIFFFQGKLKAHQMAERDLTKPIDWGIAQFSVVTVELETKKSMGKSAGNLRIHEFARKTAFAFGLGAELPFDGKERGGSGKALSGILAGHRKVRSREHSRFCPGLHPTPHGEGSEKGDAEQRQGIVSGVQGLCQTEGCEIGRDACGPFPDGAALRRRRFRQMARA